MSKYGEYQTIMKDPKHLAAALEAMGFTVECHAEPQTLLDWHGHARPEKAEVIIRRHNTGLSASNDIGFARSSDGTFRAIVSEYDKGEKFNDRWLGLLKQEYTISRQLAVGRSKGYIYSGRETTEKGEVRLRFQVR